MGLREDGSERGVPNGYARVVLLGTPGTDEEAGVGLQLPATNKFSEVYFMSDVRRIGIAIPRGIGRPEV
jgi:hypothetical protein